MSTTSPSPALDTALANIEDTFRQKLITAYLTLKKDCVENRYDAAGLATGKFCEVVLRLLQQTIHHQFTPFGTKINNFADECRKLITAVVTTGGESERIVIPRALVFVYTMRSKRGIGHVGGDVDANAIDTATMARVADWIICELIRINHGMSLEEAQDIVDGISIRQLPVVWEVGGKKRVLRQGIKAADRVLLLLYSSRESAVLIEDLCSWVEYSNMAVLKSKIVRKLHKDRFLEFDEDSEAITISPKGVSYVEEMLLRS